MLPNTFGKVCVCAVCVCVTSPTALPKIFTILIPYLGKPKDPPSISSGGGSGSGGVTAREKGGTAPTNSTGANSTVAPARVALGVSKAENSGAGGRT